VLSARLVSPTGEIDTAVAKIRISAPDEKRTLVFRPVDSGSTGEVVPCFVYIQEQS
jgi:hypothetical protein